MNNYKINVLIVKQIFTQQQIDKKNEMNDGNLGGMQQQKGALQTREEH